MHNSPIQPYGDLQRLSDEFRLTLEKRALQRALICNRDLQDGVKFMILSTPVVSHVARSTFDAAEFYWHWSTDLGGALHVLVPDLVEAIARLDEFLTAVFAVTRITNVSLGNGKDLIHLCYWEGQWAQF